MAMDRRTWLKSVAVLAAAAACDRHSSSKERRERSAWFGDTAPFTAKLTLDDARPLGKANARLCGTNVQWVDGGDGLLPSSGTRFVPEILALVKQLSPTVIRYPGGSQSDVYDWRAGIGDEHARKSVEHFHRKEKQLVRLGTPEFLALCEATGAEALITANVGTGSAKDAAEWVRQTNVTGVVSPVTGRPLPKVGFWEIGNEPYLKEDQRPETWMEPAEYVRRANAFIREMRQEDSSIRIGIPLRSDSFNGIPVTPHQGFNRKVLPALTEKFDFVSVHNAYLPFLYDRVPDDEDIYAALMGASDTVRADLESTRAQVSGLLKKSLPIAVTEFNALVTLNRKQDSYLGSPAGALYVADLLRLFAEQPDILMANHWSLIGNWEFGAMTSRGKPRPVFDVLRLVRETLRGEMLPLEVQAPGFSAPGIGLMREAKNLPMLTGTVTRDGKALRLLLLNKHPSATARISLALTKRKTLAGYRVRSLHASSPFASPDDRDAFRKSDRRVDTALEQGLELPPCSLSLIDASLG